jgi:hypothetical protein
LLEAPLQRLIEDGGAHLQKRSVEPPTLARSRRIAPNYGFQH